MKTLPSDFEWGTKQQLINSTENTSATLEFQSEVSFMNREEPV